MQENIRQKITVENNTSSYEHGSFIIKLLKDPVSVLEFQLAERKAITDFLLKQAILPSTNNKLHSIRNNKRSIVELDKVDR